MWIKHIKPKEKTLEFAKILRHNLENLGIKAILFEVYEDSINLSLRLLKPKYHKLQYELRKNNYFYENEQGKLMVTNGLLEQQVKKHRFLQTEDWAYLDEALNLICDSLSIEATIFTQFALGKLIIRDGTKNTWYENFESLCYDASVYPEILEHNFDSEKVKELLVFDTKQTTL